MTHFRNIFRFGWPYLRRYWARLFLGVLLGVVFGLSSAVILRSAGTVFNRLKPARELSSAKEKAKVPSDWLGLRAKGKAIEERIDRRLDPWLPLAGRDMDARQEIGLLLLLPVLFAFRGFAGYFSSYFMGWVSERVINDMRLDVLVKLNSLSLDFFNRSTMGDLLTRINADTSALQRSLNLGFSDLIKEPITVIGIFAVLLFNDWKLTVLVLVFLPLCVIPIAVLGKKARRASQGGVKANVSQASQLVELLSSIRVVKAFGLESEQVQRFRNFSKTLIHHGMKGIQARELVNPLIETISAFGLGLLIVYIFKSERNLADMVIFLGGVASVYTPFKKLASLHILFQQTSIGVDRLVHILTEQPTVREPSTPRPISEFTGQIAFENVTFAYGERPVLRNVTLSIPRGAKIGVAGESGSGKSTLLNLLFRFYDVTSGTVKIDGHDLREFAVKDLRQLMALVSQEIVLFDQSIAENIAMGKHGATQAEIEEAARGAFAHDFILQLPQGYETRVGERGVTLSGGQRQRIAIARAFIRDAPILVLDEATASLDSQAEAEVQAAIERLSENRTVLCVAHRLSTLANLNRIIVLSHGRIIEDGSFEELLERDGLFALMARKQGLSASNFRRATVARH